MLLNFSNLDLKIQLDYNHLPIISHLNLKSGDKLGVLGNNGSGKTTLLNLIYKQISTKFRVAYFQQNPVLDAEKTYFDYLNQLNEDWWFLEEKNYSLFNSQPIAYNALLKSLSGGEITKLLITNNLLKKPEIWLLDEPTNHLDLEGLKILTEILQKYEGILIFISHNQSFLNEVGNNFLELENQNYLYFKGKKRILKPINFNL